MLVKMMLQDEWQKLLTGIFRYSVQCKQVLQHPKNGIFNIHSLFQSVPSPQDDKVAMGALESALAAAEDETDVIALKSAKAEAVADLEEFDENVPLGEEGAENTQPDQPELSKAEQEVQNLVQQVS